MELRGWHAPDRGALFVVTGASGTGKTTLVKAAIEAVPELEFSVSATTRGMREGEIDGVDYHFVDHATFAEAVEGGRFLEHAEVYGNRYGTPRRPVERVLAQGGSVLLEIDMAGARQVREAMPEAVLVFVCPPSLAAIEARLRGRATDSEAVIARRLADAKLQLSACGEFDYLVINDDLDSAHRVFQGVLLAELSRRERRGSLVEQMTTEARC